MGDVSAATTTHSVVFLFSIQMENNYSVYQHVTPDGFFYFGQTNNIKRRWRNNGAEYKTTTLQPYIEQYGWDNIQHIVLYENLPYVDALKIEDSLIISGWEKGNCINKQRSGLVSKEDGYKQDYDKHYYKKNKDKKNQYHEQYYEENKKKLKEYGKKHYETNKNKRSEQMKRYYEEHRDEIIEQSRQYYQKNREKKLEQNRQRYQKNRDEINERRRQRYQKNRDKILEQNRQYRQRKKLEKQLKEVEI